MRNTSSYSIQIEAPSGTIALGPGETSTRIYFNQDSGARIYAQGIKVTCVMTGETKIGLYTSNVVFGRRWVSCYLFGLIKVCGGDPVEV